MGDRRPPRRLVSKLLVAAGLLSGAASPAAQTAPPRAPRVELELDQLNDPAGLEQRLRQLLGPSTGSDWAVANGEVHRGGFRLGPGQSLRGHLLVLRGTADLSGQVPGNVVVLDGDLVLRAGSVVGGDALAIGGRIREEGGKVRGERRSLEGAVPGLNRSGGGLPEGLVKLAGLAGMVVTITLLGFGLVLFARPKFEVVSDTAAHSPMRSLLTGLLAQVVAVPTAGLLVIGLVMSVVGILLVPFVAITLSLLAAAGVLMGFIAVLHAMGESQVRRRMAAGAPAGSPNSYRYLRIGIGSLAAVWLVWVAFGWVPVAGMLVLLGAGLATWLVATIGLGAFLLSRAGTRPAFTGRFISPEALTDEYLWATPQLGVSAVKRPAGGPR